MVRGWGLIWSDPLCCKYLQSSPTRTANAKATKVDKCAVEPGGKVKTRSARRIFAVKKAI